MTDTLTSIWEDEPEGMAELTINGKPAGVFMQELRERVTPLKGRVRMIRDRGNYCIVYRRWQILGNKLLNPELYRGRMYSCFQIPGQLPQLLAQIADDERYIAAARIRDHNATVKRLATARAKRA